MKYYFIILFSIYLIVPGGDASGQTPFIINHFAGRAHGSGGGSGFSGDGGPATAAKLNNPRHIAADNAGNLYIGDYYNYRIRKVNAAGVISTVAGTGTGGYSGDGGPATAAQITCYNGLTTDRAGNLYFSQGTRIRKINTSGIISTIAGTGSTGFSGDGGPATAALLSASGSIAYDTIGNLYFPDAYRVRKIDAAGIITTIAGNGVMANTGDGGPASSAELNTSGGIAVDGAGNVYVAVSPYRVRKIDAASGIITTAAGNGTLTIGGINGPATAVHFHTGITHIAADGLGNLYISDAGRLCKVDTSGMLSTLGGIIGSSSLGDHCALSDAGLNAGFFIAANFAGNNIYIGDQGNDNVRKIYPGAAPLFAGGHSQYLALCLGAGTANLNSLLAVNDSDVSQTETWSVVTGPAHGTLSASYATTSTGSLVTPAGMSYTPTTGYTGNDTFSIKVLDCGYAADTTTIYVSIISSVPGITISGSADVCAGAATLLVPSLGSGVWSSSNPSVAGIGSATGVVTGVSAGTVTITYSVSLSCGSGVAYKSITVNPVPGAITGYSGGSVCPGTSITLGSSTSGGLWSSSSPAIATAGSVTGVVTGVSGGAAVITYALSTGCGAFTTVAIHSVPAITGLPNVCMGTNSTFSTGGSSGVWSSSSTGIAMVGSVSGVVTPVSVGTATITYTLPTGCVATKAITVNPVPAAITGSSNVCVSAAITLSHAASGGVWSASNANAAIGSASGVVTGVSAGADTISYTLITGCTATKIITVDPLPASITGTMVLCANGSTALAMTSTGGTWSSGATGVATVGSATGIVSGVAAGTAGITYTLPTGCYSTSVVTVLAVPASITGAANVCVSDTATLATTSSGGVWSSGSPGIATIGSGTGIVAGMAVGTAAISYTLPTGCFNTVTVTVHPLPAGITGMSSVCAGASVLLTTSLGGGTWTSGATGIATVGSSTGVVTGVATGAAGITYTSPAGCASTTTVTVDLSPTAITGSTMLCISSTTTLSNAVSGGYWTSSDALTADVDISSGVVTGMALGTATITYTMVTSGCYITVIVTVNPAPTAITGTGSACVGAVANLYNSIGGGVWTSGNFSIATINPSTGTYTGVSAGAAIMSYSTGAGCTVTFPVTIYALPAPITGTLNVCVAANTALSSTTGGGTWSASGGATVGPTGIVTGASAGTAIISYTLATGCRATATVTVHPLPTAITGTMQVCPATTSALSGSPVSGTWLSSNTAVAIIGSGTGIVSGVATGTSVIRYTLPTGCSITRILTVNALPPTIIGASSVCVGTSATMTSGTGGTWSRSNTNITIGTASGVVTGVNAGTAVVTYTLPTGCYVTKTLTINSSPGTIGGTMQVCVGGSAGLTMTSSGSGVWSSGSLPIATIGSSTGIVSGVVAGTAGITYSVGTGCAATATVTVHALPGLFTVTGGGSYCVGGAGVHIGLSGSATGVNYQLYLGTTATGAPLAGTGAPIDFGFQTTPGIYTIVATNAQGCTSTMTGSVVIAINPLPGPIGGPSAVCVGSNITLTNTGGGTWLSGTPATATIGSTTGIVSGVAIGTTTITYTLPTTCEITKTITVSNSPTAIIGPSTVCAGASATLTVTPAGGVWSSPATTVAVGSLSGIVAGVTAGPATVTYSLGSGCTVTKTMTVLASPAAIGGSSQMCVAGSTSLTMTTSGGVWTSGSTGVATVSGTGVVSGVSAGTAVISYTAGGCSSTKTMTVNAVPSAITGLGAVCVGATSAGLSVTPGGGTWSTTATTLLIGSTDGVVSGVSAGTGVVTYSLGTGLTACSVTRMLTVNAAPVISGASGVCVGSTSAWSVGAVSGVWTSGAIGIASVSPAGLVTGVSTGVAAITFTPVTGCIAIKTMTVNTTPGAITGTAQVCAGASTALNVTSGSGGVWTSGSIIVATIGSLSGVVNGVAAGVATITYSLGTGCTVTKVVTVNPLPAAVTGGAAVCIGSTTVLSSATTGGAWSSGSTGIATVTTLGVVTGIATGTATISYTLPTGCVATRIVTVNSLPGSISGAGRVCDGATTTLTVTSGSGVWSSSNPSIASIGSGTGIVTGVYAGTATITFSQGPGCEVTRMMTVDPLPGGITGTSNICIGATTTLTTASSGGSWSSGTTGIATVGPSSGIVTGVSSGTATISYTVTTTGCASTYNITVITVPLLTGLTNLCAWGDTVSIFNSNPAGTYSSSLVTVLNLGGGAGRVTAFAPGTGYITYTLAGVGCSRTTAVTVNTLPGLIAGTTNLCVGSASTLSNSVGGGVWSSGVTSVATIGSSSGLLTGVGAGSTYIRYTIPNGCKVDTVAYVSVFPVAGTITGATDLCVGDLVTLTVTSSGGVWSSGATGIAGVSVSGIVTGVSAGTAAISYAVTNVCGTATATHTPIVNAVPDAGVITGTDSLCVGSVTTLSNIVTGGVWSSVNGNAVVSATGLVTGVMAGMDTVVYTVTSAEGCVSSAKYIVKVKPWGLCGALASPQPTLPPTAPSLEKREGVFVWPNPARDELHVENAMGCEVRIFNMLGQEVLFFDRLRMTNKVAVLKIDRLTPGVYVVEVVGDFGKESRRLVIAR